MTRLTLSARVDPTRSVLEPNPNVMNVARTPVSATILQVKAIDASGVGTHNRGWVNWVDFFWAPEDLPLMNSITASVRFAQGTVAMYSSLVSVDEINVDRIRVYTPPEIQLLHSFTTRQAGGGDDQLVSFGAHNWFVFATAETGANLKFPGHAEVNGIGELSAFWTTPN